MHILRSKTDQEGTGHTIAIVSGSVACPVKAVRAWLEASKITTGPMFRPIGKGGRIGTEHLADHANLPIETPPKTPEQLRSRVRAALLRRSA